VDIKVLKSAAVTGGHDRVRSQTQDVALAVTSLYQAHSVEFLRLAVVMLGDRMAAEDVVQDAFCGLYRRWHHLDDQGKALSYVRSALLNGCRNQLRARIRARRRTPPQCAGHCASAEDDALVAEEHREVLAALRMLPARQREANRPARTRDGSSWLRSQRPRPWPR
jgi:RNA polymerase sigma factor (sigma-70 family)